MAAPMPVRRLVALFIGASLASLAAGPATADDDARGLDSIGRVLTVGNWAVVDQLRVPDSRRLSWELRDGARLVDHGSVPGTVDGLRDANPALARNPVTGDILLAWSRETTAGPREIVTLAFLGEEFRPETENVVVSGLVADHGDPVLIHDARGAAYLAWRRFDAELSIRVITISPGGVPSDEQSLSGGMSLRNGAPRLGVDPSGNVLASFLGLDSVSLQPKVFVMSASSDTGGVIHLPTPIIELGVRVELPAPDTFNLATQQPSPKLHLTVLGGTTVAWWRHLDAGGTPLLSYLIDDPDTGWAGAPLRSIVLSAATDQAEREALEMLEVHLRHVVTLIGGSPTVPVRPVPPVAPLRVPVRLR